MERAVLDLVSRIDRSRFSPVLCCLKRLRQQERAGVFTSGTPSARTGESLHSVTLYEGLLSSRIDIRALFRLWRILRKHRAQAVYAVGGRDALFWGPLAAWLARVPVTVCAIHSMRPGVLLWLNRLLLRRADAVVAVAEAQREYLVAREGIVPGRAVVIHNGVELGDFTAGHGGREVRSALGLEPEAPLVGIVAGLRKVKRHDLFLRAAALLAPDFPLARFLVVGDGPERGPLGRLRHQLGLDETVLFLGHRTDVPEIMSALEVFALTSESEAFPLSVLEAMAAATPVVAADVGAVAEAVLHGETGYLVKPHDPEAMARAIYRLLRHPERARRMGLAGRSRVQTLFPIEANVAKTQRLLEALLTRKSASQQSLPAGADVGHETQARARPDTQPPPSDPARVRPRGTWRAQGRGPGDEADAGTRAPES